MCIRDSNTVRAVFLPSGALHQKMPTADLAPAWIVPVVQSFKEVGQDETVIAVELQPFGKCCAFAFDILLDRNISAVLCEVFHENLQRQR